MEKIIQFSLIALLVLLMAAVVVLAGCTASGQNQAGGSQQAAGSVQGGESGGQQGGNAAAQQGDGQQTGTGQPAMPQDSSGYRNGNRTGGPMEGNTTPPGTGNFGNMTGEQRQRMFGERMQQAAAACEGKAEGDSCVSQGPRGNETATCQSQDGTLLCLSQRGMGRPPGGNNWAPGSASPSPPS